MDQQKPSDEPRPAATGTKPGKRQFWGGVGTLGIGIAIGIAVVLLVIAMACFALMGRGYVMMSGPMMGGSGAAASAALGVQTSQGSPGMAIERDRAVRSHHA